MDWSGSPMTKRLFPPRLQARTRLYWASLMSWNSSTSRWRKALRPVVSSFSASVSKSSKSSAPSPFRRASYASYTPVSSPALSQDAPFLTRDTAWRRFLAFPLLPRSRSTSPAISSASPRPNSRTSPSSSRQRVWKVPMCIRATARLPPSRASSRWCISPAACLVKVTAVISSGRTPCSSTSQAMRATSVLVLPVPGPATTATTGSAAVTASRCSGFSSSVGPAEGCSFCFSAVFFSSRFRPGFSAGASAPNRDICPLSRWISPGVSRVMVPYSPSKPARRSTCPSRRRRMPSATQGPAACSISVTGASRRM